MPRSLPPRHRCLVPHLPHVRFPGPRRRLGTRPALASSWRIASRSGLPPLKLLSCHDEAADEVSRIQSAPYASSRSPTKCPPPRSTIARPAAGKRPESPRGITLGHAGGAIDGRAAACSNKRLRAATSRAPESSKMPAPCRRVESSRDIASVAHASPLLQSCPGPCSTRRCTASKLHGPMFSTNPTCP